MILYGILGNIEMERETFLKIRIGERELYKFRRL